MSKKNKNVITKRKVKEFLLINLGVFLMAAAYSLLLDPNHVIVGGVGGISTIVSAELHVSSSLVMLILNLILLVFALIFVGKDFFIKTAYASLIYPLYAYLWELIRRYALKDMLPDLTSIPSVNGIDPRIISAGAYLVIVIFGAVISGFGLGLALRNGASTGGVDIIQRILLKYFKLPFSVSLIFIDGTIVLVSGLIFKDIFTILYGAMFIFISGYVMDAIIFSGFNSRCVNIVTSKPEEIKEQIFDILARGVTVINAKGGFTNLDRTLLVCVMSNNEFYKMKEIIYNIDEKAFIYVTRASEVHGEGFTPELTPDEEVNNGGN